MLATKSKAIHAVDGLRRLVDDRLLSRDAVSARFGFLSEHLVGGVFKSLRLGQIRQRLLDHRIPIRHHAEALLLAKLAGDDLLFDVGFYLVEIVVD